MNEIGIDISQNKTKAVPLARRSDSTAIDARLKLYLFQLMADRREARNGTPGGFSFFMLFVFLLTGGKT